jgi:hypothetical protein
MQEELTSIKRQKNYKDNYREIIDHLENYTVTLVSTRSKVPELYFALVARWMNSEDTCMEW